MKKWVMIVLAACGMAVESGAQSAAKAATEENLTVITSERLTFEYLKHYALFEVNVVVVDPEMRILADKMTVFFDDNNKATSIKAEGQVYIIQEDKKARADLATYDVASGKIVLTGTPQVTRGKDVLTGDVITFFRDENRMIVEPRAKLVIFPQGGGAKVDPFFGK